MKTTIDADSLTETNQLLSEIRDLLRVLVEQREQPNHTPLLLAIAEWTAGRAFTAGDLMDRAEILAAEDQPDLQHILRKHCELNSYKLGQLLKTLEGRGIQRVRNSRNGWVWKVSKM